MGVRSTGDVANVHILRLRALIILIIKMFWSRGFYGKKFTLDAGQVKALPTHEHQLIDNECAARTSRLYLLSYAKGNVLGLDMIRIGKGLVFGTQDQGLRLSETSIYKNCTSFVWLWKKVISFFNF